MRSPQTIHTDAISECKSVSLASLTKSDCQTCQSLPSCLSVLLIPYYIIIESNKIKRYFFTSKTNPQPADESCTDNDKSYFCRALLILQMPTTYTFVLVNIFDRIRLMKNMTECSVYVFPHDKMLSKNDFSAQIYKFEQNECSFLQIEAFVAYLCK